MARRNSYRTTSPRRGRRSRRSEVDINVENGDQEQHRVLRYTAPWCTFAAAGALTEVAHLVASTSPTASGVTVLGVAGTGAALGKLVHHLDRKAKRDGEVRALHAVNTAAVTVGATVGTFTGLESAAAFGAYALAGTGISLANNVFSLLYKKGAGEKGESKWKKLEDEIGLAKHELKEAQSNGKGAVICKVEAKDGATADEFARKIPALAGAVKAGQGRVTHSVNEDDVSDITMRVQVADMLKDGVRWPGPSAFGTGFGDTPLPLGRYEDGEDLLLNIPGVLLDPKGLATGNVEHCVAQGVNGSGKTQGNAVMIAEAATRREVSIIVINCTKFAQDYGHVRHAADMVITDPKQARRFFKQLKGPVIDARSNYLASKGLARWEPGCGLNFLMIIGEEAADFADGDAYGEVLRALRSTGGWFESSIQRATHDQMDTTARSNHPAGMAYGLQDGAEASYILPPEAIEAGAFPGWGNRKPGYLYVGGLGIPQERWHVTARTYFAERDTLAAAVTAGMNVRTPMDEVTSAAFGPLWENRTAFTTPLLPGGDAAPAAPPMPTEPPAVPAAREATDIEDQDDEDDEIEVDEEMIAKETAELEEELEALLAQDPEPGQYSDLTAESEIPEPADDAPTFDLPAPAADGEQLDPEAVRQLILSRLSEWFRTGTASFEPKQVSDLWLRAALKDPRSWWNRLRKELLDTGVIEESEEYGEYDIVRDPLAHD